MVGLNSTQLHIFILAVITTIASALPFLTSYPLLIGEPFDTRLQIVIHEHWFLFLNGERPLRDLYIFYPFDKTLGYSDIFLVNGLLYSFARFLEFDIITAWNFTNFLISLIGTAGFAILLNKILKNKLLIYPALLILTNNYAYLAFLTIWPNIVGYLLISWALLILYKIHHSNKDNLVPTLNALFLFIPILTMSYWYVGFFTICGTLLYFSLQFFADRRSFVNKFNLFSNSRSLRSLILISPVWLGAWTLFFFISFPTLDSLSRTKNEFIKGSLSIKNFFANDFLEPNFLKTVIKDSPIANLIMPESSWSVGFSIITITFFILIKIFSKKDILNLNLLSNCTFIAIILTLFLTIRINEFSFYIIIWEYLDIFGVIRTPVRINLLVNMLMLLVIFKFLDSYATSLKKVVLSIFFVMIISLDQFRILSGTWSEDSLINQDLKKQSKIVSKYCDFFSLTNEGAGIWSDTIEGMVLSSLANVPTMNGYSGAFPKNSLLDSVPDAWNMPNKYEYSFNYIDKMNIHEGSCILTNANLYQLDKANPLFIDIDLEESSFWEYNEISHWIWIAKREVQLKIFNPFRDSTINLSNIFIEKAPCVDEIKIRVLAGNKSFNLSLTERNPRKSLNLSSLVNEEHINLTLITDSDSCKVGNDPRDLAYSIYLKK